MERTKRTGIPSNELTTDKSEIVASLVYYFEREGLINENVVMDPQMMNRYFGDRTFAGQIDAELKTVSGQG